MILRCQNTFWEKKKIFPPTNTKTLRKISMYSGRMSGGVDKNTHVSLEFKQHTPTDLIFASLRSSLLGCVVEFQWNRVFFRILSYEVKLELINFEFISGYSKNYFTMILNYRIDIFNMVKSIFWCWCCWLHRAEI